MFSMPRKPAKPPARDARDDRVTFRCSAVLRQAIEKLAAEDRRSVSDWIVIQLDRAVNLIEEGKD